MSKSDSCYQMDGDIRNLVLLMVNTVGREDAKVEVQFSLYVYLHVNLWREQDLVWKLYNINSLAIMMCTVE